MLAESQMNEEQPVIDDTLVRRLIATQFPQWAELSVRPMTPGGWDNRIFRLGQHMLVRMPSAADYELQVEKEHRWLPRLVRSLPLPIPTPLAMGRPGEGYPWKWSVYGWIDGDTALATPTGIADLHSFATSLAQFLIALQCIDPTGGPSPGPHNFYRGGALATYDAETREAVAALKGRVDVDTATHVWEAALATAWPGPPVWVHGDVHAGNLLLKGGRLSAVLDFGQLGVGDPACDLSIAWTLFEGDSRETFRTALPRDAGTWARGRAWALWKAMIVAAGLTGANAVEAARSRRVIEEVLTDHRPHRPGGCTT